MNELLFIDGRSAIDVDYIYTFEIACRFGEEHLTGFCVIACQAIRHYFGYLVHEEKVSINAVSNDVLQHVHAERLGQHIDLIGSLKLLVEQPVQKTALRCLCYQIVLAFFLVKRQYLIRLGQFLQ